MANDIEKLQFVDKAGLEQFWADVQTYLTRNYKNLPAGMQFSRIYQANGRLHILVEPFGGDTLDKKRDARDSLNVYSKEDVDEAIRNNGGYIGQLTLSELNSLQHEPHNGDSVNVKFGPNDSAYIDSATGFGKIYNRWDGALEHTYIEVLDGDNIIYDRKALTHVWDRLAGNYKHKQQTTTVSFDTYETILDVTQNDNGEITVHKCTIPTATVSQLGLTTLKGAVTDGDTDNTTAATPKAVSDAIAAAIGALDVDEITVGEAYTVGTIAENNGKIVVTTVPIVVGTNNIANGAVTSAKIADGTIQSVDIGEGQVQAGNIGASAVTTAKVADGAITTNKIETGAVTSDKIADGTIQGTDIGEGQVGTANIANSAVTESKIATDAVTEGKISDGAVTESKLGTGAVTSEKIADGTIQGTDIGEGQVDTANLANSAVTEAKIASIAVTESKIATGAVTGSKIATGAVTSEKIADGTIQSTDIGAGEVQENNIGSGAVTNEKIAAGAVETTNIASGAVTGDKIGHDAVNGDKIADNAINTEHLVDDSVTAAKVKDGEVLPVSITGNAATATVADNVVLNGTLDTRIRNIEAEERRLETAKKDRQTPIEDTPTEDQHTVTAVTNISQDADGVIAVTKKSIRAASTSAPGIVQLSNDTDSDREDLAVTPKALKQAATSAIASLNTENLVEDGKYINSLTQQAGHLVYSVTSMDNTPSLDSGKPVTSGGVHAAIQAEANDRLAEDIRINTLIPPEASDSNKLADKAYVDAIGERLEARYLAADSNGNPFPNKAAFVAAQNAKEFYYNGVLVDPNKSPNNNDVIVVGSDESQPIGPTGFYPTTRYRYQGIPDAGMWCFEYVINNTALSQSQLNAINSGITATDKTNYDTHVASDGRNNRPSNPHKVTFEQLYGNDITAAELGVLDGVDTENLSGADLNTLTDIDPAKGTVQFQLDEKATKITGLSNDPVNNLVVVSSGGTTHGKYDIADSGVHIVSSYDGADTANPATGSAIKSAIDTALDSLDADVTSSHAGQKVSVNVVETNGKITAVTVDDSNAATANQGALADSAIQTVYLTDSEGTRPLAKDSADGNSVTVDLSDYKHLQGAVGDPTAQGTSLSFIDSITQNASGVITPTKKAVTVDQTYDAIGTNPASGSAITTAIHTLESDPTSSDGTNVQVQVVQENGVLTEVHVTDNSANQTDITNAINALDVTDSISEGKYITSLSETDGKIAYNQADMATDKVQNSKAPITAGGVYKVIDDLDATVSSSVDTSVAKPLVPNVDFTITEESGKLTGITITRDVTVNQTELSSTVDSIDTAKANKVSQATAGDVATLTANGDLADSGQHITSVYSDDTAEEGHEKDEYLANPVTGTAVDDAIVDHLNQLDITKMSTQGKNVQVSVEQEDGLIKSVNVTLDQTINNGDLTTAISNLDAEVATGQASQGASAAEQAAHAGDVSKNIALAITEVDGKLTKAVVTQDNTINATDLSNAIHALDSTVSSAPDTGVSTNIGFDVVEENGVLTGVTITRDISVNQTDVDTTVTTEIGKLNATSVGGTGKYIAEISETGGIISATEENLSTVPTEDSVIPITSGAVYTAIHGLDAPDTAVTNQFVTEVSETDGVIQVTRAQPSFSNISGTLPVSQGGTGATTEAGARTNLDVYSKTEVNNMVQGHGKFLGNLSVYEINALWDDPSTYPANSDTVICVVNSTHTATSVYVDSAKQDTITVRNGEQLIVKGNGNTATWESVTGSFKLTQTPAADIKPVNDDFSVLDGFSQDANGEVTVTRHTLDDATQSLHGLMSSSDKVKLDSLPVRSDLDSTFLTKVDKVTGATAGNIATFVAGGNVQDSGTAITSTYSGTDGTNPVTGVAVKSAIDALDATVSDSSTNVSVSITETDGKLASITVTDTAATSAQGVKADNSIRKAYVNQLVGGKTELTKDSADENAITVDLSGYKTVQTPVAGSTADTGSQLTFVYDVSQNANGVVASKTRAVKVAHTYSSTDTDPISGQGVAHAITTLNPQFGSKADKVDNATAGNFAGLDANGNLTDSGSKASDFKTKQSAVSDPSVPASGTTTSLSFIDSISQDTNGVITPTKKKIQSATTAQPGVVQLAGSIGAIVASENNHAATEKAVRDAINDLDVELTVFSGNETIDEISQVDGKLVVGKQHIQIGEDQVWNLEDDLYAIRGDISDLQSDKQDNLSFEGTYDESTNKVATESTVSDAIEALDVSNITGFGAGKTLKTLTETDGKIAATFQDIAITKSQVTDFSHAHGDITNDGKITASGAAIGTGDTLVIVDSSASGALKKSTLAFDASTTDQFLAKNGTWSNTVERATKDASGNVITSTYETKAHAEETYIPLSQKGVADGVATLGSDGKVPSTQLPSFVDDVIEGYYYNNKFYKDAAHTTEITGESGKIYVDLVSNKTYRWGGSAYAVISDTLALGETSSTAYRGDRGKIAYDHSLLTSGNPHNVTASDVGLGNVDNKSEATIKSDFTGSIASGNTGFVTGGDVYTELGTKVDKEEGKGLSTNDYTTAEKNKLAGIAAGAEVNQNAFSNVKVGNVTVSADAKTDTLEIAGSRHVTVTPDATNDKITISTDIQDQTAYTGMGSATKVPKITTNTLGQVTSVEEVTISGVTPAAHAHGNITNAGAIGSTSGYAVYTTTNGVLTAGSLASSDPTASGTTLSFIDTVSQDAKGKITATKKSVTVDSTYSSTGTNPVNGTAVAAALSGYKPLQTAASDPAASGTTITAISTISQDAEGVITATKKTIRSASTAQTGVVQLQGSIGVSESSDTTAATPKAVRDAINALDVSGITANLGVGKTITALAETDGKISATASAIQISESQVTNLTTDLGNKASATHVHGNITNDGKITSDTTLASGMKLVITDGNSKVARSAIAFDASDETKALTPKGTWTQFLQEVSAGNGISVSGSGTTRTVALNLSSIPVTTIAALA